MESADSGDVKRPWTLLVKGGGAFVVGFGHNPYLSHKGGTSVWKLFCSRTEILEVKESLVEYGVTVTVLEDHQEAEPRDDAVLVAPDKCALCFFYSGTCSLAAWDDSMVTWARQKHKKAEADYQRCVKNKEKPPTL